MRPCGPSASSGTCLWSTGPVGEANLGPVRDPILDPHVLSPRQRFSSTFIPHLRLIPFLLRRCFPLALSGAFANAPWRPLGDMGAISLAPPAPWASRSSVSGFRLGSHCKSFQCLLTIYLTFFDAAEYSDTKVTLLSECLGVVFSSNFLSLL